MTAFSRNARCLISRSFANFIATNGNPDDAGVNAIDVYVNVNYRTCNGPWEERSRQPRMQRFEPSDSHFERRVRHSFARQGVMSHIGAQMMAVEAGQCEIHLPYGDHVSQQHGFFHGGIVATIADSAAGYAGFSLMPAEAGVLTVEFKINLVAPADGDLLVARGSVVRPGRTLTVTHAEVAVRKDGQERVCAFLQQTLMTIVGRRDVVG